jgi:hypothetical protein
VSVRGTAVKKGCSLSRVLGWQYQLPVASFQLPVAGCQLPVTSYQLPVTEVDRLPAVKAHDATATGNWQLATDH